MIKTLVRGSSMALLVAAWSLVVPLPAHGQAEPAPANDDFAAAQVLTGAAGSVNGTNESATKEPGEPDHAGDVGGASVWYSWTAPTTATVRFDTCASDAFDTVLAIYTGNSLIGSTEVARGDDECRRTSSRAEVAVTAGVTYRIAIDGRRYEQYTAFGTFTLTWGPPPSAPPSNDTFAAATVLTGTSGSLAGTNELATTEGGEPTHAAVGGGASVWYSWTAAGAGRARFDTCANGGADFDTVLAIYTGSQVAALTEVQSNDDGCASGASSRVVLTTTGGTTYRIAVDGIGDPGNAQQGRFTLTWSQPPANDGFGAAQALTGASGSVPGTNEVATKQPSEPNHAGDAGGASVWYSWTAPATGTTRFDTCTGTDFDTLLAVYTGTRVAALTKVVGNDDACDGWASRVDLRTTAGTTYRIAIDGRRGGGTAAQGAFTLSWAPRYNHQPDVWIRKGAGTWAGDGIHNRSGAGQTKNASVGPQGTATFSFKLESDGAVLDAPFTARGASNLDAEWFLVTYRLAGGADVTASMEAGRSYVLDPRQSSRVDVTVTALAGAPAGATVAVVVGMSSDVNAGQVDVAVAQVTRN